MKRLIQAPRFSRAVIIFAGLLLWDFPSNIAVNIRLLGMYVYIYTTYILRQNFVNKDGLRSRVPVLPLGKCVGEQVFRRYMRHQKHTYGYPCQPQYHIINHGILKHGCMCGVLTVIFISSKQYLCSHESPSVLCVYVCVPLLQ